MWRRMAVAARLPPGVVARHASNLVVRDVDARITRRRDRLHPTHATAVPDRALVRHVRKLRVDVLRAERDWIVKAAALELQHRFDLLGSGWLKVEYGMTSPGVEGNRYPPGRPVVADPDGRWLEQRSATAIRSSSAS